MASSQLLQSVRFTAGGILPGPKPICVYPRDSNTFLNLDNVSLWLMSVENFHGSRLMLYNQQMDLYALVYYVTLLDITARGFQRAVALAFLTSEKPDLTKRSTFRRLSNNVFRPFLSCNRSLFCSYAEHIVELANEIQRQKFHIYYSLHFNSNLSLKIKQIAKQARVLLDHKSFFYDNSNHDEKPPFNMEFMDVYRLISSQQNPCECGKDLKEFDKFIKVMEQPVSTELTSVFKIAPCIAKTFDDDFKEFYNEMTQKEELTGALFSGGLPVFKNFSGPNVQLQKRGKDEEDDLDANEISVRFPNENSLTHFSAALVDSLYSLLSGQKIAVLASDLRKTTAIDLLTKLNDLRVCRRKEPIVWKTDSANLNVQTQVFGVSCQREESKNWKHNSKSLVCIDLNNNSLLSQVYKGRLLQQLFTTTKFLSDKTLNLYIVSIISDICLIARVARKQPFELIASTLKLNSQDLLILANILSEYDLIKYTDKRDKIANSNKWPFKRQRF